MSDKLKEKIEYTTAGFILCACNYLLIETRFNVAGLLFGLLAAGFFIKALMVKEPK
jgi:uncharacterized membrane protein YciS (DUF1049 family)